MVKVNLIVATSLNNAIGYDNKLLYHLPNDLKRFKKLTEGHKIIMGRKTFESLQHGPLPNRTNIVLSRCNIVFNGTIVVNSLEKALKLCEDDEEVFVIGGETLYQETLAIASKIYMTIVDDLPEKADAFFPEIDKNVWKETFKEEHTMDEKHKYNYQFIDYERK